MTNAELIAELRGHILSVPLTLLHAAADALEAAEQRIKELSLDCELFQQKCMELDAQKPKDGEWIMLDPKNGIEMCSRCRYTAYTVNRPNFCPNCGARMRGEHDEQ